MALALRSFGVFDNIQMMPFAYFVRQVNTGKFMLTVFAALSQLEREQLKQRQREGIEIAKAQGKYTGRKPIPTDWTRFGQLYGEWRAKNITGRDFMRRMDMSANTFYRRVREYEIRHGIAEQTSA